MDSMTAPMAPAIMQTKGGKSLKYATRLEILLGGQLTAGTKRLTAAAKGCTYSYAIETKIKILKNHLDAPHNVMYEGPMIACDLGFVAPEDLQTYKKEHITSILKELQGRAKDSGEVITEKDITFDAVDSEE